MTRIATTVALAGLVLGSCVADRPSQDDWLIAWQGSQVPVDTARLFDPPLSNEQCQDTLAQLREWRTQVEPTPDRTIDRAVREWFQAAEESFFECPPDDGFEATFTELDRLRAEVDAALTSD